jgi:Predicted membrane protein
MNKRKIFNVAVITIAIYVAVSWILPLAIDIFGGEAPATQIGLVPAFLAFVETLTGFGNTFVFILSVGVLYAILKKSGQYDAIVGKIVNGLRGSEKLFIISLIVLMTVISSVVGLELGMLIFIPLLISVILGLGYDKMVALSATVLPIAVGTFGATFSGTTYGVTNTLFSLSMSDSLIFKAILFALGLGLTLTYVLLYIKKAKFKLNAEKVEVKEKTLFTSIILGVLFIVVFLGTIVWGSIYNTNIFATAHDAVMGAKVGEFDVFNKLFGGVSAFGTWNTPYRFEYYSVLILIVTFVIAIVKKVKKQDLFDAVVEGLKEYVVYALIAMTALAAFVLCYYYPILQTVQTWLLGLTKEFNVATGAIYSLVSGVFYPDYYYYAYYIVGGAGQTFMDSISVINILCTSLYGIVMLVAPTSIVLLIALALTDTRYAEWIKYIWKLLVALLVAALVVLLIAANVTFNPTVNVKVVFDIVLALIAIAVVVLAVIFVRRYRALKVKESKKTAKKQEAKKVSAKAKEIKTTKKSATKKKNKKH